MRRIKDIDMNELLIETPFLRYCISPFLLNQQNAWDRLDELKDLHTFKMALYSLILETTDENELQSYCEDLSMTEFELQRVWGFPLDANYHRWWEYPKCACPKMDNNDAYPLGYYTTSKNCPLHKK